MLYLPFKLPSHITPDMVYVPCNALVGRAGERIAANRAALGSFITEEPSRLTVCFNKCALHTDHFTDLLTRIRNMTLKTTVEVSVFIFLPKLLLFSLFSLHYSSECDT